MKQLFSGEADVEKLEATLAQYGIKLYGGSYIKHDLDVYGNIYFNLVKEQDGTVSCWAIPGKEMTLGTERDITLKLLDTVKGARCQLETLAAQTNRPDALYPKTFIDEIDAVIDMAQKIIGPDKRSKG